MNIDNQTVLHIKAGQMPPEDLLVRILATKPTAFGFAVQEADGADMQTVREDATNLDLANLNSFMEGRKERPTSLYFGTLKEGYDADDIQPFTICDPDNNTFMTIFTEGTFNGHDEPAAHSEHFNLVNGVIIPKIVEWCEDFGGDIEKIMTKINGEVFNKDFLSHIGHRAVLHILPFKGDAVLLAKNELGAEFDWGWTSRTHGFGEVSQEPVKVEPKKASGYWGGKKKVEPVSTDANGIHHVTAKAAPKDVATKGEGPRQSESESKATSIHVRPPSWLHKNDDKKEFYVIVSGKGHPGWKKSLPVEVTQNHSVLQCKNYDEYLKWRLENLKASTSSIQQNQQPVTKQERVSASQQVKVEKTVTPAEVPIHGPIDPTPLPIIEPKDLEKVLDYVAKHLDGNSKEIMSPKDMQKLEAELPNFGEATATSLEDQLNWSVSGLFGLAATDARAMVLWGLQWRAYARPFLLAELRAKAKDGVKTTEETKVKTTTTQTGNTKKVESVVVPAAAVASVPAAAAKKNSWGYGKNKAA